MTKNGIRNCQLNPTGILNYKIIEYLMSFNLFKRMFDSWIRILIIAGGFCIEYITRIILAHNFGTEGFGIISLGLSIMTVGASFGSLGIPTATAREISYNYTNVENKETFQISIAALKTIMLLAGITTAIIFLLYYHSNRKYPAYLQFFILSIPLASLLRLSVDVLRGHHLFIFSLLSQEIIIRGSRLLLLILTIYTFSNLVNISISYFISFAITCLITWAVVYKKIFNFRYNIQVNENTNTIRKLISISIPLSGSVVLLKSMGKLETIILGILSNAHEIGVYNCSLTIAQLLLLPSAAITFTFLPIYTQLISKNKINKSNRFMKETILVLFIFGIVLALTLFFFNIELTRIFFGKSFVEGNISSKILIISYLSFIIFNPFGIGLIAHGKNFYYFLGTSIGVAGLIITCFVAIPKMGYNGAALSNLVCSLTMGLTHFILMKKVKLKSNLFNKESKITMNEIS